MTSRCLRFAAVVFVSSALPYAQTRPDFPDQEKAISAELGKIRSLPDAEWTKAVAQIARQVQQLPQGPGKHSLIGRFGNLVTEGDAGHETLQIVAAAMADVLQESPDPQLEGTLARLARYEHVDVSLHTPGYREALAKLDANDRQRQQTDFTLSDLSGRQWSLKTLRGKVVLINFWATWCPPCRKEMPDLQALYERFRPKGLVILAISDEEIATVQPFIRERKYTYPVLVDPGRKVHRLFVVEGIPMSFVFNREGRLVAEAMDRRTETQFLAMLRQAGVE